MTEKKRAEKLIIQLQATIYEHGAGHESTVSFNVIKKIALFCVEEMINENVSHAQNNHRLMLVKEEILKL